MATPDLSRLFWHWIRPKVRVDQHPFVVLLYINTSRLCSDRIRFSILVNVEPDVIVSQDRNIAVVDLDLGICHLGRDILAGVFASGLCQMRIHRVSLEPGGIIAIELGVVVRHIFGLISNVRRILYSRGPLRLRQCDDSIGDSLISLLPIRPSR